MCRLLALLPFLFVACASSAPTREASPELEQRELSRDEQDQKRREIGAVMVRLDQAIDSYAKAMANQGEFRADEQAARLERYLRETVLDENPPKRGKTLLHSPGENLRQLRAIASDGSNPDHQGIALAALGFSGMNEMMPVILQGALLRDAFVVDRAVFGLAVLRCPSTPVGVLLGIVDNVAHPEEGRVQAAWALYRLQEVSEERDAIVAAWQSLAAARDRTPVGVLVSAVRGLGLARDPANAELCASFLKHSTPRLRMAAALAIGRMNAQDRWRDLLELLGPQETVQNVRLHARKALAELAGGTDHGYDVAAWRKTFDRG
jgi:hypothetical protein